ncbi:MAG: methyltransferase domain-containing protein [Clostridia bacterium]
MAAYKQLSYYYDDFTEDVPYDDFINYYESVFSMLSQNPRLILDLGCGTGTLTNKMAERGFEMIGVDYSEDMLMEAQSKSYELECTRPIFLRQSMQNLDLFGTIDACVSSLDCINYIVDPKNLAKVFAKVDNFLNPDGIFIFDINTVNKLENLDGQTYVRENDNTFCVWQASFEDGLCTYNFDIFVNRNDKYDRYCEEHIERAYEISFIKEQLEIAGFYDIKCYNDLTFEQGNDDCQRVFFVAKSKGDKKCETV